MNLGMKVAPDKRSMEDLKSVQPDFTEVWFNYNEKATYEELFFVLRERVPHSGLHFWGMLANGHLTTFAYDDPQVTRESADLVKRTIDIAQRNGFSYVNIHPGPRALVTMDFKHQRWSVHSDPTPVDRAEALFRTAVQELQAYAHAHDVLLTVETVPMHSADNWLSDKHGDIVNLHELPVSVMTRLADLGVPVANDFGHTAATVLSSDPIVLWNHLYAVTKTLAPYTRLIHIGFTIPPFDGTDYHDTLENPLFASGRTIPNKMQIIELFKLFKNRSDVNALVEPKTDHVKNFLLARALLEEAGCYHQ